MSDHNIAEVIQKMLGSIESRNDYGIGEFFTRDQLEHFADDPFFAVRAHIPVDPFELGILLNADADEFMLCPTCERMMRRPLEPTCIQCAARAAFPMEEHNQRMPIPTMMVAALESEAFLPGMKKLRAIEDLIGSKPGSYIVKRILASMEAELIEAPELASLLESHLNS
jgi:hypothetical protein